MGYYIFSVGIDEEKLNKAIHSKDEDLFNNIMATESYQHYSAPQGLPKADTVLKEALRALIFDTPLDKEYAYFYGYAFICLCQYLGTELPYQQEIKLWVETDLIDQYALSDFNVDLDSLFLNEKPELPFAKPKDWPAWGLLSIQQLPEFMQRIEHIHITEEEIEALEDGPDEESEDKACAYAHLAGIKQNIQFCLENNLSFASFCH